jgi:hypothetical protein
MPYRPPQHRPSLSRVNAPRDWSLCVQGPSGSGKTEFARYVARRMALEIVHVRGKQRTVEAWWRW